MEENHAHSLRAFARLRKAPNLPRFQSANEVFIVKPVVVLLSLSVALSASAQLSNQTSSSPVHNHAGLAPAQLIDGAVNPELIADSTAYRLFFLVAGNMPDSTPQEQRKQNAHLRKIGLTQNDNQQIMAALNAFRVKYSDLVKDYNDLAEAATSRGESPDLNPFLAQREALVQSTVDTLKRVLTPSGFIQVHEHIQREKHGIKIFVPVSK